MNNFVDAQKILNYCDTNISIVQKGINEWLEHTIEYKETHDYIIPLRERLRALEDFKRFIIELTDQNIHNEACMTEQAVYRSLSEAARHWNHRV